MTSCRKGFTAGVLWSLGDGCLWGNRMGGRVLRSAPQRESACWVLCFEACISLLQAGILEEGFSRTFINVSRCALY